MARSKSTRWYAALAVLVAFILLAWLLGGVLTLTDGERVGLRVGLIVLGLAAAGALLWYLRPVDEPVLEKASSGRDDAIAALAAARARLSRGALDAKPIVLVLGSQGSSKTTVVTHSGTDPQLLAGDAPPAAGDAPKATAGANVWLVRDAVLVEAGTRCSRTPTAGGDSSACFARLVSPPRSPLDSASRAAVLCVSCDLFYSGGAGEQLDGLARMGRERLSEAA
jgi:type VI secretion system protein ImpL